MKATLTFQSYDTAKAFARDWALFSRQGYSLGAKNAEGGATLTLYNVTEAHKAWIDSKIAEFTA